MTMDLVTLKHLLLNKRFRQDIKSLKSAKKCYTKYAWELLEELEVINKLKKGITLNNLVKETKIKDSKFLETILDLLVGTGNLSHSKSKYFFRKEPMFSIKEELKHLETHCPGSTEWTHWLRKKSKNTIQTGKKFNESSFDDSKGIFLWEKVMQESPYSLRQIALEQLDKKLKDNQKIIDIGCGGGIGLEEILLRTNYRIQLFGLEVSKEYLKKAKKRLKKLQKELSGIKLENCKNTKFIICDLTKERLDKKFDAVFISLVVNHIEKEKHKIFFENIKKSMNEDAILVSLQFMNFSKFERSPMWVMHNIPSHKDFPYFDEFIPTLKNIFPKVKLILNGIIISCSL
jgi:SAM-dependent methyltransferase